MKQITSLIRKELSSYFGSPMALIFVGVFFSGYSVHLFLGRCLFRPGDRGRAAHVPMDARAADCFWWLP